LAEIEFLVERCNFYISLVDGFLLSSADYVIHRLRQGGKIKDMLGVFALAWGVAWALVNRYNYTVCVCHKILHAYNTYVQKVATRAI